MANQTRTQLSLESVTWIHKESPFKLQAMNIGLGAYFLNYEVEDSNSSTRCLKILIIKLNV